MKMPHSAAGSGAPSEKMLGQLYPELRRIARGIMARERKGHTWQPTALVHEAVLRVLGMEGNTFRDKEHFLLSIVGQMRRLLISHARKKYALKRRGSTSERQSGGLQGPRLDEALSVEHLLERLKGIDERAYRVVMLRFYGGLSEEEAAHVMKLGRTTVRRDWEWARAWMYGELTGE